MSDSGEDSSSDSVSGTDSPSHPPSPHHESTISKLVKDSQDQSILSRVPSGKETIKDTEAAEPHPNSFIKLTNLSKTFGAVPKEQHAPLIELTRPHRDSFDWLVEQGLFHIARDMPPVEFPLKNGCRVGLHFEEIEVVKPFVAVDEKAAKKRKSFSANRSPLLFPAECRQRGMSYKGGITASLYWKVNDKIKGISKRELGEIPIMLQTKSCNLYGLNPKQLIEKGEEEHEMGGYFVINGIEKVVRMLIMTKRNYPLAMERKAWKSRGPLYTEKGIMIRSVMGDQSSLTNTLHYLSNGNITIGFTHRKEQFLVPIIMVLKCLVNQSDFYIFKRLMQGEENNSFLRTAVVEMVRSTLKSRDPLGDQQQNLAYIGKLFRVRLVELPPWWSDEIVGHFLVRTCILPHLGGRTQDKFNLLVYMARKLFRFVDGKCCAENPDSPMNQEILLPGHLLGMLLKERLMVWLTGLKTMILKADEIDDTVGEVMLDTSGEAVILAAARKVTPLTKAFEYLLATGNVQSTTGLGLMQAAGFSVVAEKINFYRFLAHFRCVHRGAYFTEMRTTAVRKLLPEAWGFLCPVHTPDGTPCGLLNHLAASCEIVNRYYPTAAIRKFLKQYGLVPCEELAGASSTYPVMLDGKLLGGIPRNSAVDLTSELRKLKATPDSNIPEMLEIGFVPSTEVASQDPGIFLALHPARMMRPVKNLSSNSTEWIGAFEQVYLNISVDATEVTPGQTTHTEISKTNILSVIANLTPFSDYNQSPRNMYQCQMGKQTMATPTYSYPKRADNKLYRIMTPQTPMVRPKLYDHYQMDNYPMGTNAVVAVISYTGYDMEDAMIINKGSYERGFCWGYIYKSEIIDLREVTNEVRRSGKFPYSFGNPELPSTSGMDPKNGSTSTKRLSTTLEADGLPAIGTELKNGDDFYSYVNYANPDQPIIKKYRKSEPAYVEQVKALQSEHHSDGFVRVCITLRIVRPPIIGDKFASRHGQKGVCSLRFASEDMPFCESGIVPDIIFNPHGYPSRMTIGMMLESMAGKSVSMNGRPEDASPFSSAFDESRPAHEYHGNLLRQAGFDYYGTETMYSGINGEMMKAEIFIGVVYYQRLRHMVSDKYQVRTTGPIDSVTRQPVKGRKMGGGVRFGEMERDALLSHGCSFLLQERLMNVSDRSLARICLECKQLFTTTVIEPGRRWGEPKLKCRVCSGTETIRNIVVPYCFQYLVAELAAVNIKTEIVCKTVR